MPFCVHGWNPKQVPSCHSDRAFRLSLTDRSQTNRWIEAKPYPQEFRDDVVRVARDRGEGVTIEQVAKDFGVHPMTLHKWMRRADIDEGRSAGVSATESAELREARKRIRSRKESSRASSQSFNAALDRPATISSKRADPVPSTIGVRSTSTGRVARLGHRIVVRIALGANRSHRIGFGEAEV